MSQHSNNRNSAGQNSAGQNASGKGLSKDVAHKAESASSAEQLLREMQDEVSPEATPLWQFVNDNAPKIVAIVVSLVLVISGYAFYQGYQESSFSDAKRQLSIIISNTNDAERLSALEVYKSEAPAVLLVAIELEIAQASVLLGDFVKAQSAFSYVKNEEGNSPLGISATINIGDILARQGEAQKAIDMYESVMEQIPSGFRVALYTSIADVAANANLKEKAVSAYKDALNALPKDGSNAQDAEYFSARIMELS